MIAAFAPATVSNVACGFDVLGFALDEPGDVVMAGPTDGPGVTIVDVLGDGGRLPREAHRNTAGASVAALLSHLQTTRGVALTIHKGLPLESGIGSSGASAVAAVVAANELLGPPVGTDVLLACAAALAAGETPSPEMVAASGSHEGLRPWVAWSCLAFVFVGMAAAVYLEMAVFHLPPHSN